MKKTVISLVAVAALASSAFAANSVSNAFANGKVSGNAYFRFATASNSGTAITDKANWPVNNKGVNKEKKTQYEALATLGINYSTASYYGLSFNAGFQGYAPVYQDEWNTARISGGANGTDSLMNIANLQFSNKLVTVTAGRQAVGLEWLTHYIQGATAVIHVPMTQIVLGWATQRSASSNETNRMKQFTDLGTSGAYVVEATVTPIKMLSVKAYYYDVNKIEGLYGVGATLHAGPASVTAKYAGTAENSKHTYMGENAQNIKVKKKMKNSSFMAIIANVSVPVNKITLGADGGYAMVGNKNVEAENDFGVAGDKTNPFDDGSDFYRPNAKTYWVNLSAAMNAISANVRYGSTDLGKYNGYKMGGEDEINAGISYAGIKNTTLGISYDNLNYGKGPAGYKPNLKNSTFKFDASYSF